MRARRQPFASNERLMRRSRTGDDVGLAHRRLESWRDSGLDACNFGSVDNGLGAFRAAGPDQNAIQNADRTMGLDQRVRQRAGADHEQSPATLPRQVL